MELSKSANGTIKIREYLSYSFSKRKRVSRKRCAAGALLRIELNERHGTKFLRKEMTPLFLKRKKLAPQKELAPYFIKKRIDP